MILTNEARALIVAQHLQPEADDMHHIMRYTDAIEAAVVARLATGVSVEPDTSTYANYNDYPYYSLDQLTTAIAATRVQENERCATHAEGHYGDGHRLAGEIRALIGDKT